MASRLSRQKPYRRLLCFGGPTRKPTSKDCVAPPQSLPGCGADKASSDSYEGTRPSPANSNRTRTEMQLNKENWLLVAIALWICTWPKTSVADSAFSCTE